MMPPLQDLGGERRSKSRVWVIACGNPLRSDDGLAWHAAEQLRRTISAEEVEISCVHQLTPELAESLSRADAVIFLDATCNDAACNDAVGNDAASNHQPGTILCKPIAASAGPVYSFHQFGPEGILSLCSALYAATPLAFTASICGESFDHGTTLSQRVSDALPQFVRTVEELLAGLITSSVS